MTQKGRKPMVRICRRCRTAFKSTKTVEVDRPLCPACESDDRRRDRVLGNPFADKRIPD